MNSKMYFSKLSVLLFFLFVLICGGILGHMQERVWHQYHLNALHAQIKHQNCGDITIPKFGRK